MDVGKLNAPYQITEIDPWLAQYEADIVLRMDRFKEKYGADYIYVSSYERSSYEVDEEALENRYEIVFQNREAVIYRVK